MASRPLPRHLTPPDHHAHSLIYSHITRQRNGSEQFHYYNDIYHHRHSGRYFRFFGRFTPPPACRSHTIILYYLTRVLLSASNSKVTPPTPGRPLGYILDDGQSRYRTALVFEFDGFFRLTSDRLRPVLQVRRAMWGCCTQWCPGIGKYSDNI